MSDFVPKWCNSNSQRSLYPSNFASPPPFPPPFTPPPFAFQRHPQLHYHAASPPVTGQVPLPPSAFPSSNTEIVQPLPLHIDTAQDKVKLWMKTCKLSWPHVSHVKPPNCTDNLTLHTIKIILHKLNLHKLKFKASSSNKATITEPSDPEVSTSETSETHPSAMHTCLSSVDHSSSYRMEEIEKEMQSLLEVLEDRRTQEVVVSKIAAAQKRKLRRRNTQQRLWEQRRLEEEHKANQHKEIETWLDGLQETKRTEEMKKAADESMADVRHKIADVVRHKELIVSWTKLRSIRLRKRQSDDGDTSETFVDKMAALNKLLDERLELYKKEEKALKVMLEIEQEETLAKEARIARVRRQRQHDRLEKGRELWLFGSQVVPEELKAFHDYYTQAEESLDTFLQIRGEWDRFLVPEHVAEATRIPQGWVIPTEPSSELWQKYLKNHELTC